jgi:hypothetical protein
LLFPAIPLGSALQNQRPLTMPYGLGQAGRSSSLLYLLVNSWLVYNCERHYVKK